MPLPEEFPFAKERRLLYVALTRARRGVFIYTLESRQSAFLVELANKDYVTITDQHGAAVSSEPSPVCGEGLGKLITGPYRGFYGCSNYPRCKWKENI